MNFPRKRMRLEAWVPSCLALAPSCERRAKELNRLSSEDALIKTVFGRVFQPWKLYWLEKAGCLLKRADSLIGQLAFGKLLAFLNFMEVSASLPNLNWYWQSLVFGCWLHIYPKWLNCSEFVNSFNFFVS